MKELSLFTGAGGGLLGTTLLGWQHVGYVEYNDYCQRVIRQRILDGILENAPIFGDIRTFIDEGYADSYQGMVDVVTAGFPCQPFSVAGKQQGADDDRNMWPETLAVLRKVRPRYALLENVPGLLTHEYARTIYGDLAESGFHVGWDCIPAGAFVDQKCGDRFWAVVASDSEGLERLYNALRGIYRKPIKGAIPGNIRRASPRVYRRSDGMADRVERTRAIGNGQVPAVVRAAWELLNS